MKKLYKTTCLIVLYCISLLWLIDFQLKAIIDLKLMGVMFISILLLSMASKQQSDQKRTVGFQILMTSLFATTLLFLKSTADGVVELNNIRPLLYGGLYYLMYLLFCSLRKPIEAKADLFDDYELTLREITIVKELLKSQSNKEIGEKLFIAESTVKKHLQHIYKKTQVKNRQEFLNHFHSGE